ncbi:hypothetical protein ACIOKD_40970 [Streptomyces sp. NPDC087844]|uniref:hypothetical protein n=1 Tax=Streptomyces sp. NPDC087844 TaxID=3365805 RepID=UPI00382AF42B
MDLDPGFQALQNLPDRSLVRVEAGRRPRELKFLLPGLQLLEQASQITLPLLPPGGFVVEHARQLRRALAERSDDLSRSFGDGSLDLHADFMTFLWGKGGKYRLDILPVHGLFRRELQGCVNIHVNDGLRNRCGLVLRGKRRHTRASSSG